MPRSSKSNASLGSEATATRSPAKPPRLPVAKANDKRTNGHDAGEHRTLEVLLDALEAMSVGDFSVRLPSNQAGIAGKVADRFNQIVTANERMAKQLEEVGQVVGQEGKTRKRVRLDHSHGAWGEMEESINSLIDDLLWPTTAVTHTIAAVARGDLL